LRAINPQRTSDTNLDHIRHLDHLFGDVRSFFAAMASDALFFRSNLLALLLLLVLSLLAAAKTVSKPGDWVAVPKIGVPNSWAVGDERIVDGDPLQKIEPEIRNKHRENVPVFRKVDGECDCEEPTMCRKDRLSPESVRKPCPIPVRD
jgi:hypothetical protein